MTHAHPHSHLSAASATGLTRRAAIASVIAALTLIALKAWAAAATGSVSVLGSLADSGLDLLASLITLGGVSWAAKPADEDHRFGHGKAEALSALAQTVIISVSATLIVSEAIRNFSNPEPPSAPAIGIGVSIVAILVTASLIAFQRRVVRATGSVAVSTDRMHYASDLALNLAVIAALALEALMGLRGADSVFAVGIALALVAGALRSGGNAVDILMDKEWPDAARQRLLLAAADHPAVRGVHELRTRGTGLHQFAQFHIWVDPGLSVAAAHEVVDAVEARVGRDFPGIELLIHVDPAGHRDQRPGPAKRADRA